MGRIGCPETSITNYQCTLCTSPGQQISHSHRGESLKSRRMDDLRTWKEHDLVKHQYDITDLIRKENY